MCLPPALLPKNHPGNRGIYYAYMKTLTDFHNIGRSIVVQTVKTNLAVEKSWNNNEIRQFLEVFAWVAPNTDLARYPAFGYPANIYAGYPAKL